LMYKPQRGETAKPRAQALGTYIGIESALKGRHRFCLPKKLFADISNTNVRLLRSDGVGNCPHKLMAESSVKKE
jgi:hypothetical protein